MLEVIKLQFSYLKSVSRDKRAVTALEYGLIAAVMATAVLTAFKSLGGGLTTSFTTLATKLAIQ